MTIESLPLNGISGSTASGAVFVDNLTFASVNRLLFDRYSSAEDLLMTVDRRVQAATVLYDISNLANLVDTIVCHELIFTNTEYIPIWAYSTATRLESYVSGFVRGISVDRDQRQQIYAMQNEGLDDAMPHILNWANDLTPFMVSLGGHDEQQAALGGFTNTDLCEALVLPGSSVSLGNNPVTGLAYYAACSERLGTPFRPSTLRAAILESALENQLREWRHVQSAELPLAFLEEERAEVMRNNFSKLYETNIVNASAPVLLRSYSTKRKALRRSLLWQCSCASHQKQPLLELGRVTLLPQFRTVQFEM